MSSTSHLDAVTTAPLETSAPAPLIERVLGPFQRFFSTNASSGLLLLATTAVALVWANSPWAEAYHHLWDTPFSVGTPTFSLALPLHAWVNDGLMAIFFFLVGLEIKREVLIGELSTRRSAALPVAAALGGMLVPALLFASVNAGRPGAAGWGVPMATDIAFALGILALLGNRVPSSLRVFLAALAIADDLGAVLVIAFFYTSAIDWSALGAAGVVLLVLIGLNRAGARRPATYALLGAVLWLFMLKSGIHATIAGVLLALTVPARTRISEDEFLASAEASLADFRASDEEGTTVLTNQGHQDALQSLESAADAAQSPLQQMEHALHGVVAFFIMPIFALANAGVSLGTDLGAAATDPIAIGVALGLLLGKPIGITLASFLAVRGGAADLPSGASWGHVHGAAWLGGIGFTMSLFIAGLAFKSAEQLDIAKLAVLGASTLAGVVGYTLLRLGVGVRPTQAER
ncbi:Na+/H+ antiporter NhaA [Gemmatimonas groenlandica]|uniref:Na(+)/H(+) antiporter NhaA n=1 Tax=Gemmatimonas groenlandica TaxID=2732249 RepID=A0A6M4IT46_9BACT|nr:Na+/H+ antiporter NhaA [Gemmatimonas groenlandica]QJR37903.1 Na+/H+ antiporter NhaA [Gemmatimonas groenlandica]